MLDPQRVALNAESVGFLQRTGQKVDWDAYSKAMQTDYNNQNSAVQVRRERDAAKNEVHIMGGQGKGFESNELILTQARQQRQINGYPLRQFSASQPAVILPKKYGGFSLYNRNQLEYPELVSVFTEPMSAPLQSRTELLSRMGQVALSNDASRPYEEEGFINPMTRGLSELAENVNVFRQRQHLQNMAAKADKNKRNNTFGNSNIYMNANGEPMSQAADAVESEISEAASGFTDAISGYESRRTALLDRDGSITSGSRSLYADPTNNMATLISSNSSLTSSRLGSLPTISEAPRNANQLILSITDAADAYATTLVNTVKSIPKGSPISTILNNDSPEYFYSPRSPDILSLNGMQAGSLRASDTQSVISDLTESTGHSRIGMKAYQKAMRDLGMTTGGSSRSSKSSRSSSRKSKKSVGSVGNVSSIIRNYNQALQAQGHGDLTLNTSFGSKKSIRPSKLSSKTKLKARMALRRLGVAYHDYGFQLHNDDATTKSERIIRDAYSRYEY